MSPMFGPGALLAFGLLTAVAGLWLTVRFYTDPHVPRGWRRATAILGLAVGLVATLVWYHAPDGSLVLGFPFPALTADLSPDPSSTVVSPVDRMLHGSSASLLLAFANFAAGVGLVHLLGRRAAQAAAALRGL